MAILAQVVSLRSSRCVQLAMAARPLGSSPPFRLAAQLGYAWRHAMRKGGAYESDAHSLVRDLHGEALVRLGLALRPCAGNPGRALQRARPEVQEAAKLLCQVAGVTPSSLASDAMAGNGEETIQWNLAAPRFVPSGCCLTGQQGLGLEPPQREAPPLEEELDVLCPIDGANFERPAVDVEERLLPVEGAMELAIALGYKDEEMDYASPGADGEAHCLESLARQAARRRERDDEAFWTMVVEANGEGDELRRWQLATGVRFPAPPVGLCGRGALSTPGGVHPRGTLSAVAGDASKHCSLGIASATRSSDEQVPILQCRSRT